MYVDVAGCRRMLSEDHGRSWTLVTSLQIHPNVTKWMSLDVSSVA